MPLLYVEKVVCFIMRGADEMLAFAHRDNPQAGIQVPAGTIEPGERPDVAALREAEEETGLPFTLVRKLGVVEFSVDHPEMVPPGHENQRCHVFELAPLVPLADTWSYYAEDSHWFEYGWLPLGRASELDQRGRLCAALITGAESGSF